jgi:hypothetical protein|tara:strand:+ start:98 stop:250 length:153 start_codon:yes stop_codon:yes gene_type:complete
MTTATTKANDNKKSVISSQEKADIRVGFFIGFVKPCNNLFKSYFLLFGVY